MEASLITAGIIWVVTGSACMILTGNHMGYLRWTDLLLIPFGIFWLLTPWWYDEEAGVMWRKK